MKRKKIGIEGIEVSAMGLGCMGMSEFYGAGDDQESIKVIGHALDLDINFLDTADMYGPFTNEVLVGQAIRTRRKDVVLATKCGVVRDPANPATRGINGRPAYIRAACEASLQRLKTDWIDLYYLHRKDPEVPIEDSVGAMSDLVKAGKIRAIGLSEVSAASLEKAHTVHPVAALQTEYSLWSREPEDGLLETCKALSTAFVAYSPLGRGFLTGQIKRYEDFGPDDVRRNWPRFQGDNFQKNLALVEKIGHMAKEKGCTPSQLALAWVMAQGEHIIPIPGTKKMKYLIENAAAADMQLSAAELRQLEDIAPKNVAAGNRYPDAAMGLLNQ